MAVADWTENDLAALVGSAETSNLEFKASPALAKTQAAKNEMAKDISAMANAAGGVIVYGIAENADHLADHIDEGVDPAISAEWIDQVLTSNIEPKVAGVLIKQIPLATGRNAYALDIPQATAFAPHQSKPQRQYFTRRNTTTEALLDHEIRDLMRRGSSPEMFARLALRDVRVDNLFALTIDYGNLSPEPALYSCFDLWLDNSLALTPNRHEWTTGQAAVLMRGRIEVPSTRYMRNFSVPGSMPIFAERAFSIFNYPATILPDQVYSIGYAISCPGFAVQVFGQIVRLGVALPLVLLDQPIRTGPVSP